jgi:hypothetical protein
MAQLVAKPPEIEPEEGTEPGRTPAAQPSRTEVDELIAAARAVDDPVPLLAMLASKSPIALAEVCCGARAPGGPRFVRASLAHAAALEAQLSPRGAWGRLIELAGDVGDPTGAAVEAFRQACARHPAAGWLLRISRKVEGATAGHTQLVAAATHPSFAQSCFAHAEAGHVEGLVLAAAATGRAEPAAALLEYNQAAAVRAGAAALETAHDSPVIAHLAAVWGPEPDALIAKLVPHLQHRRSAESLLAQAGHLAHTSRLLRAVIPGMAR